MSKMSNKKALEILLKTDRVGVNLILGNDEETTKYNQDSAEALHTAIKALEVVDKIEKAFINRLVRQDNVIVFNNANYTYFTDAAYHILCDAYGTEESMHSWITEYNNE